MDDDVETTLPPEADLASSSETRQRVATPTAKSEPRCKVAGFARLIRSLRQVRRGAAAHRLNFGDGHRCVARITKRIVHNQLAILPRALKVLAGILPDNLAEGIHSPEKNQRCQHTQHGRVV